jgi:hypothetical protein
MALTTWSAEVSWSITKTSSFITFDGQMVDITNSGIVPPPILPTHASVPFTGQNITQLGAIPPGGIAVSYTFSVDALPSGTDNFVAFDVTEFWTSIPPGQLGRPARVISTNGLLGFADGVTSAGPSSVSGTFSVLDTIPIGMFGGTGAYSPVTHWAWFIYSSSPAGTTHTGSLAISFQYEAPCWEAASYAAIDSSGGTLIDFTPSVLPAGATTTIPGWPVLGDLTAVAIPSPASITDLTITSTMEARPNGEVDIVLLTFDAAGNGVNEYTLGTFTPSIPSWLTTGARLLTPITFDPTEVYWYLYAYNTAADSGHTLAVHVRYYCHGLASDMIVPISFTSGPRGLGKGPQFMTVPASLTSGQLRRRGRSYIQIIGRHPNAAAVYRTEKYAPRCDYDQLPEPAYSV